MKRFSSQVGENQDTTGKCRHFMDLAASEHLANSLLIFPAGRDPKIAPKEQTEGHD